MAGMNCAIICGNVGKDPTIRTLSSGDKVANFSIATSKSWKDKDGERREVTQWHNIVVWNEGLIGIVERYVKKGSKILVRGEIETRKWEKDGQDHYSTEIVLNRFGAELTLLGDKGDGGSDRQRDDRRDGGGYQSARDGGERSGGGRGGYSRDLNDEVPF